MRQQTLAAEESFEKYRKPTRREHFFNEMNQVLPWAELSVVIEPFFPQAGGRGRCVSSSMLRIHFQQHGLNQSDPAMEDALYDSRTMRCFVGVHPKYCLLHASVGKIL